MRKVIFFLAAIAAALTFTTCNKSNNTPSTASISITSFSPTHAFAGDTVTIIGKGFASGDSVLFDGVLAQMVSATSTEIKVKVPDNAVSGNIQVTHNGYTATSSSAFTVDLPVTANATVTKLADIPAYPTNGGSGVRMVYSSNSLFITGPGTNQDAVYKLDLTTNAVAKYISMPSSSLATGIAAYYNSDSGFMLISSESVPVGNNYLYVWRFGNLTNSSTSLHIYCNSIKFNGSNSTFIGTDFSNKIYNLGVSTAGGNTVSTVYDTLINTQLFGIPNEANAMLGVGTSGKIFVFANHALWQLQPDKSLTLVAGQAGVTGYTDAQGSAALFQDGGYARGNAIAVDNNDNVYVADYGSGCIRKVDNSGNVTTLVGNSNLKGQSYTGRGDKMAFFFDSWDIAFGSDYKTLYVIGRNNSNNNSMPNSVYKVAFQ